MDELRRLGEPAACGPDSFPDWEDYQAIGVTEADVPALLELVRRAAEDLNAFADERDGWAPLHAWRALGQLRATAAIEPLLALIDTFAEYGHDYFLEDLPEVMAQIGPPSVDALGAFLADDAHHKHARPVVTETLLRLAQVHSEAKPAAVSWLQRVLAQFEHNDPELNGHIVMALLDLQAAEAAETIERAYAAGRVDEGMCGTWDDVRSALDVPGLGLITADSPENPNSLRDWRKSFLQYDETTPRSFIEIQADRKREKRKRKRRRR